MIRVAFVSRWEQIEGDYEYGRNLVENIRKYHPDIEITPFVAPFNVHALRHAVAEYDVVHFNFVYGPFSCLTEPGVITSFIGPRRVVLTFHENNPNDSYDTHRFLRECARVVVHERNNHGFVFIPQGIPVMDPCVWSPEPTIGTSGFPFPDKRVPMIAKAAALLISNGTGITGCTIHAPDTAHANTWAVRDQVLRYVPTARYETLYAPQEDVLSLIATNLVNVYIPNSRRMGPSGSVRIGLATGSHIVLSRSAMFRDLAEYNDEVEWVDGLAEHVDASKVAGAVLRVIENGKRPKRVLEDGSWKKSAASYADLYRSIK